MEIIVISKLWDKQSNALSRFINIVPSTPDKSKNLLLTEQKVS